jgi:[ribosomal protein S18]-alanine N-acetyltransferase
VIRFRVMGVTDIASVLENEQRAYQFPWTEGNFADCLSAGHECWLLSLDEEVAGHGILAIGPGEAHVLNVCVRRDRQGNGYGRALMQHLLARARERGAATVFLEVRPSNRVAIGLYRSLGFNEIGRRRDYYPSPVGHEDAEVMGLDLALHFSLAQVQ